jgi:hypothetical protein
VVEREVGADAEAVAVAVAMAAEAADVVVKRSRKNSKCFWNTYVFK